MSIDQPGLDHVKPLEILCINWFRVLWKALLESSRAQTFPL